MATLDLRIYALNSLKLSEQNNFLSCRRASDLGSASDTEELVL
jgi:hypothetical protein